MALSKEKPINNKGASSSNPTQDGTGNFKNN